MVTLTPEMMDRAIQWAYLHETGVSYVPPAAALCQELMKEVMAFANQPPFA